MGSGALASSEGGRTVSSGSSQFSTGPPTADIISSSVRPPAAFSMPGPIHRSDTRTGVWAMPAAGA